MKLRTFFFFLMIFSVPCYSQESGNSIDLNKVKPRQFLSALRYSSDTAKNARYVTISYPVPAGWITKADAEYLLHYVYSDEKCKCVVNIFSSFLPDKENATIGGIAMDMIDSYRKGTACFPSSYYCTKTDGSRANELMKWWQGELEKEKIYESSEK